jgi:hypothetical protein
VILCSPVTARLGSVVPCSILNNVPFELLCFIIENVVDRLCGLVVRVPGYRYRDPGFDSRRYQIF